MKGPENPTCQLLPISRKRKVKTKMGKKWRKADCVKKARMSRMRDRVRELLVTFFIIKKKHPEHQI